MKDEVKNNQSQVGSQSQRPSSALHPSNFTLQTSPPQRLDLSQETLTGIIPAFLQRHAKWVWLAVLAFMLSGFNGQWRIGPDSASHLLLARSLVTGQTFEGQADLARELSPGLSWVVAAGFAAFGTQAVWPAVLAVWLAAAGVLLLTCKLFALHERPAVGLVVVVMLACTEAFFRYAFQVMPDMFFALGFMMLLVGYESICQRIEKGGFQWKHFRGGALALALAGLAVMAAFRSVVLVVVAGLAVTLVLSLIRWRKWKLLLALAAGVALAVMLMRWALLGFGSPFHLLDDERIMLERLTQDLGPTLSKAAGYNLMQMFDEAVLGSTLALDFDWWSSLPLGVLIFASVLMLWPRRHLWPVLLVVCTVQWLLFMVSARYLLPFTPVFAYAWWRLARRVELRISGPWQGAAALAVMLVLYLVPNTVRCVAYVLPQHAAEPQAVWEDGMYLHVMAICDWARRAASADAVLVPEQERLRYPYMYLSDRTIVGDVSRSRAEQGELFAVTPMSERNQAALQRQGLRLGETVFETTTDSVTWRVQRVEAR